MQNLVLILGWLHLIYILYALCIVFVSLLRGYKTESPIRSLFLVLGIPLAMVFSPLLWELEREKRATLERTLMLLTGTTQVNIKRRRGKK